jgi:hypothetical protein
MVGMYHGGAKAEDDGIPTVSVSLELGKGLMPGANHK